MLLFRKQALLLLVALLLTDCSLSQLDGTETEESDGIEGDIQGVGVVGEGYEAVDTVCEGGDISFLDLLKMLPNDLLDCLEGKPDDHL